MPVRFFPACRAFAVCRGVGVCRAFAVCCALGVCRAEAAVLTGVGAALDAAG
jgi:hypothetical protein